MRVMGVWCPDWPTVAVARAGVAGTGSADANARADLEPIAVLASNRVLACNLAARTAGVRRGMKKRQAQSACSSMRVVTADDGRDARMWEPVVSAIIELIPTVEVVRPGMVAVPASGAARYFGSEGRAAEGVIDAVSAVGVDVQVGIADELSTAIIAARHGVVVEPGKGADFLAPLHISELAMEPGLSEYDRTELIDLLWRLGVRTIGAFAQLSPQDVGNRFGADTIAAHRVARALPQRPPSALPPPPELAVEHRPEPPIERVDAAAFVGRRLADMLHRNLSAAAMGCTRLTIEATTDSGQCHSRTWRCAAPLTPDSTADRVRWQLDGWLSGRSADRPDSPIVLLRLEPVEVVTSGALQLNLHGSGLHGADSDATERARRALVRVQGLLGGDAVQMPVLSGGRAPTDRVTMISLGDEVVPASEPDRPWPGHLPTPAPTLLLSAPVQVTDAAGTQVQVTGRGEFTADPCMLAWGSKRWSVQWWAGPWSVDERWWDADGAGPAARAQVLLEDSRALLLHFNTCGWQVEGVYE